MGRREFLGLSETLILQVAAAGLMFGLHIASARLLPVETYGALSFGLTLGGLVTLMCCLGYPNLVLRQVASAVEKQNWAVLEGVTVFAGTLVALASMGAVVLLGAAAMASGQMGMGLSGGLIVAMAVVLLLTVPTAPWCGW